MQGAAAPAAPGGLCKDIVPATHLLGAPPQAPGAFAELVAPAATFWALRPKPRPTFSRRESRQRYARNLLVPGPPAQGGGPPWIPPPPALAVLVEGVQGLRHPRGAARQSGPIRGLSHYRQSIPHNSVKRSSKLFSLLSIYSIPFLIKVRFFRFI